MDKKWRPVVIAAVIILLGGLVWVAKDRRNSNQPLSGPPAASQKTACELFTADDAKKIIGVDAKPFGSPLAGTVSSKDLAITTCPYSNAGGDASVGAVSQTISLEARYAKTGAGKNANKKEFEAAKSAGDITVSGLGDEAFYTPDVGFLQVLKGNYWLTSSSSNIGGSQLTHNQIQAQQIAEDALAGL